jgi:hypothetical protein
MKKIHAVEILGAGFWFLSKHRCVTHLYGSAEGNKAVDTNTNKVEYVRDKEE